MSAFTRRQFSFGLAAILISTSAVVDLQAAVGAESAINSIRRAHGLGRVHPDRSLQGAAEHQARLMAAHDKISHAVSAGQSFRNRMRQAGISGRTGENVSAGRRDLASVLDGWMNSPGHRRNLLNRDFSRFGLASALPEGRSRYGIYWALILAS